jgi:hypothetical protein
MKVHRALRAPLTARQTQWIAARPRLSAWLDRVHAATREGRDSIPATTAPHPREAPMATA